MIKGKQFYKTIKNVLCLIKCVINTVSVIKIQFFYSKHINERYEIIHYMNMNEIDSSFLFDLNFNI